MLLFFYIKCLICKYIAAMPVETSMVGKDHIKNRKKLMGCPSRLDIPATITFAEAAINEPLPPKQAPRDKAHQTGIMAALPPIDSSMDLIIGIIVATKGILSIAVETKAEIQMTSIAAFSMLPDFPQEHKILHWVVPSVPGQNS